MTLKRFPKIRKSAIKVDIVVTPKDFGRIAAQKAKQVVVQKNSCGRKKGYI